MASDMIGAIGGTSTISGALSVVSQVLGFYESINNQITTYMQTVTSLNNIVARYENDPRSTPTDDLWCDVLVDFGDANQHEVGIAASFRVTGSVIIKIMNAVGLGVGASLEKADVIATAFRNRDVGRIIFRAPRVTKVGRIEDNHRVNVTCPFFVDSPLV